MTKISGLIYCLLCSPPTFFEFGNGGSDFTWLKGAHPCQICKLRSPVIIFHTVLLSCIHNNYSSKHISCLWGKQFTDQAFQSAEIQGRNESSVFIAIKGYGFRKIMFYSWKRIWLSNLPPVSFLLRPLYSKLQWPGEVGVEFLVLIVLIHVNVFVKNRGLDISTDGFLNLDSSSVIPKSYVT